MCVEGKGPDDRVFTRDGGNRIGDFRKTCHKMCCNVGLGRMACRLCDLTATGDECESGCSPLHYVDLLIHDLRRTGCRNLRRLGVHEKTIMKIGGWKTRSVFDRYNIVDEKTSRTLRQNSTRRRWSENYGTVVAK